VGWGVLRRRVQRNKYDDIYSVTAATNVPSPISRGVKYVKSRPARAANTLSTPNLPCSLSIFIESFTFANDSAATAVRLLNHDEEDDIDNNEYVQFSYHLPNAVSIPTDIKISLFHSLLVVVPLTASATGSGKTPRRRGNLFLP
jgi:hypothetical protein